MKTNPLKLFIEQRMERKGLTTASMSKRAKISSSSFYTWYQRPTHNQVMIQAVCDYLDVSKEEISKLIDQVRYGVSNDTPKIVSDNAQSYNTSKRADQVALELISDQNRRITYLTELIRSLEERILALEKKK